MSVPFAGPAGHGIVLSGAADELRAFVDRTGIPVVTTLLGIGALPASHPLAFGMIVITGIANLVYIVLRSRAERWIK